MAQFCAFMVRKNASFYSKFVFQEGVLRRNLLKNLEQLGYTPIFATHSNRMERIA
jgi:hypothetical protein